jgi:hypothetical protein
MTFRAVDIEDLREHVSYDPKTGALIWIVSRHVRAPVGSPAFGSPDAYGYLEGHFRGVKLKAHRVAWAIHHGSWPEHGIDHINGKPFDNRIENLRQAPQSINLKNASMRSDNSSGVTGVSWHSQRSKWVVRVGQKYVGIFNSLEEATAARRAVAIADGYHPNHGRA